VALIVCYTGPIDKAAEVLRPLREFKTPVLDTIRPKPYVAHQAMFDPGLSTRPSLLLEGVEAAATP